MKQPPPVLVWMDLEMTGLDPDRCAIVQMAIILTDTELVELAAPLELTIWQPPAVLAEMSPFVRAMHEKSGLLPRIGRSEIATEDAEREALKFVTARAPYRTARLCGSSIGQDRRFLCRHMPTLEGYLHYRQIDVSSLKELASWWNGLRYKKSDEGQHTALFDVRQSLDELRFYRQQIWRARGEVGPQPGRGESV